VPDLATAVLMDRFYHNLLDRRLARDQSLREAQQSLRGCTVGQLRQDDWLDKEPALVNSSPYGDGWMIKLRVKDGGEKKALLDAGAYSAHLGQ